MELKLNMPKGVCMWVDNPIGKRVQAPTPGDLLQYTASELDDIMKIQTTKGPEVKIKDSAYIAFACDIKGDDYGTVRKTYLKIKLMHARARHVICAYNLMGPDELTHNLKDSCDDQEYGAGSLLLKSMIDSRINGKAIYVVRYCGPEKLGQDRLKSYIKAADELLKMKPYNKITKEEQYINWNFNEERGEDRRRNAPTNQQQQQKPQKGRGRGGRNK